LTNTEPDKTKKVNEERYLIVYSDTSRKIYWY